MSSLPINPPNPTQPSLTFSSVITPETINTYTTSNYISNISNILINNINTKQNILTASTNILGVGSSISALDYAKITLNKPDNFQSDWTSTVTNKPTNFQSDWLSTVINKPSTFPADMTNIYNKTEVNTISNNNSNYTSNTSNILSNLINTNSNYTTITSNILNTKIDVNNVNISNLLYNTNYTDERPYPPKIFNSSSSQSTITYLGQNPIYSETITLDTSGITYGSGIYEIYSSENNTTSISLSGIGNNVFNVVNDDNYSYALFNSNGTFTTNSNLVCDILVVGGGASGNQRHSGGGGAGALIYSTNMTLSAGTYTINIGAGGIAPGLANPGVIVNGNNGGDSEILLGDTVLYRAKGGGYGSGNATNSSGGNGGSGGGCTGNDRNQQTVGIAVNTNIINGVSGFTRGNSGGKGDGGGGNAEEWSGGGGGGAGSAGSNSTLDQGVNTNGGNGGNGLEINITGTPTYYAGGGGGGISDSGNGIAGSGGLGGGGAGSKGSLTATSGTANTGGGGGGGGFRRTPDGNGLGGNGGTGVVIIRFLKKSNETKKELFNFITNETGSEYGSFNYNSSTGIYLTTDRYIKNDYFGDFLVVKLPTQILLNRFRIYSRPSFVERAPSLWKLYGSNNNNEWEEIIEGSNSILLNIGNYSSGFYEKSISNISKSYMYFGLVVSRIIGGNSNSHTLNFTEFQLFGREILFVSFNVFNSALTNYYNKTETNTLLDAKQNTLTAATNLLGIGSSISALDYNKITLNVPSTFPPTMTNIYTKTETNTLLDAKQNTLTAATNLLGIGSSISALDYNKITLNVPSTFPPTMTNIYTKTETNTLLDAKQNTLTAATNLLGIGSSISALDYNKITLNVPSTFPPTMTNIYTKTESDNRYLQLSGGNITNNLGIGTSPLYQTHIHTSTYNNKPLLTLSAGIAVSPYGGTARNIGQPLLGIGENNFTGLGDYFGIGFGYKFSPNDKYCCEIGCVITDINGAEKGDLLFSTRNTTGQPDVAIERMRITTAGNITIGSNLNSTTYKLNVDGSINSTTLWQNGTQLNTLLDAKQNTLTAATNLLGIGSSISALDYNKITLNVPSTFPPTMTNIYTKTETNTLLDAKQNTLTAATNLLGIGSSISALDYNKITLNIPSTFPPTMTNLYSRTESDNRYLQLSGGSMTGALNLTGISGGNNPLYIKSTNTNANNCIFIQNDINKSSYIGVGGSAFGGYYQNNFFIESATGSIVLNTSGRTSASVPNMIIDTAGNVGIGTTNPTSKLYVDGAVEFNSTLTTNGSCTFNISGYGTAMTITANGIRIPSGNFPFSIQEWYLSQDLAPGGIPKSFVFHHSATGVNSKWWFNGQQTNTSSEISDERIKKEIKDIETPLNKIMTLKPKEYYLCDDKDYNKKFGIIAQDVEKVFPELIHTEKDYVANIYSYAKYENGIITLDKDITDLINIDDELKIILDNNDKNNLEIVIDDTPYNNRYKRRFVKVVEIIDNHSFKIDIELQENDIFIYGKKVDDFKRLDYESLYCLNIAATQELYKIIQSQQQQIEELKQRIL